MIEGVIQNGQVCVPTPIAAPDGTRVGIELLPRQPTPDPDPAGWQEAVDDVAAGRVLSAADVKELMDEQIAELRGRRG